MKIRDLFAGATGEGARPREKGRRLRLEQLESREQPALGVSVAGSVLSVQGTPGNDNIAVTLSGTNLVVLDHGAPVFAAASGSIAAININTGNGNDRVVIAPDVTQAVTIVGGAGNDVFVGGGGDTTLIGGTGRNKLYGGKGFNTLVGGPNADLLVGGPRGNSFDGNGGGDQLVNVGPGDRVVLHPGDRILGDPAPPAPADPPPSADQTVTLQANEVDQLLRRASAATKTNDAIIAITDRNGRVLGVWVENGVAPNIQNDPAMLTYAVDGALAKARTAAFFANDQAPLTSRTIRDLSQTTITQREVDSNPSITDPNSPLRGPGFVAPVGVGAHFPPNIALTPPVDLFAIEHTNRDSIVHPGPDGIKGTADDVTLPGRFNINPAFVPPGQALFPPESYGFVSGIEPGAQSRGIATLPGGIPIFKDGVLVGGIGVFFPGLTGTATEENSSLSTTFNPNKPDRSLEAEYVAFAAVGGSAGAGFPIGTVGGIPPVAGISLPSGRIDLVGVTLNIFGPLGLSGPEILTHYGQGIGPGTAAGHEIPVTTGGALLQNGLPVPEGWLVLPHDGVGISASQVLDIIQRGILQADRTRAAIRLPLNSTARMVFAVCDLNGNLVGLFRMHDATVFSIDVAVAKSRNVNYYNNPNKLQPIDQVPNIAPGIAFTSRTFRFLSGPRYPDAIDLQPPGPFSILNDGGANLLTGLQVGAPLPASAFQSVLGHDAFNPGTNFHDPTNILNQDGIVFFPGSAAVYTATGPTTSVLSGGFGVSGDGVDQDDVVTFAGAYDFQPRSTPRVDTVYFRGARLPYQKFNRNPQGGITNETFT